MALGNCFGRLLTGSLGDDKSRVIAGHISPMINLRHDLREKRQIVRPTGEKYGNLP